MKSLYGRESSVGPDVIEGRLIHIGLRALELGINVVIDFGLWCRDERSALRQAAADLGAAVDMHYVELPPTEQRGRLDRRQAEEPHTTWHMSDEELAEWASASTSRRRERSTAPNPSDPPAGSSRGTSGASIAGLRRSPETEESAPAAPVLRASTDGNRRV